MISKHETCCTVIACATLVLGVAGKVHSAMLDQWGTYAFITTADCTESPCDSANNSVFGPGDYASQGRFADTTYSNATYGSAEAHANLGATPGLNIPTLRARAHGNTDRVTIGVARGVEAYTYIGTSSTTLDLIITLTGNVTNPLDANITHIFADVYVMEADAAEAAVAPVGNILLENSLPTSLSDHIGLDENSFGIVVGTVPVVLNPGDSFYLLANLATQAADTGTSDAMSTLTLAFSDDSNLVAASAAVIPIPAAVWLFGSGLLGLAGIARLKRNG